jgi:beta-phosphoglucomutase family hydrolase
MNATIAVIWDMDGVLVNTGNFHYKAWRVTLDEHGIPFSFDTFRKTFGMNNEGILRFLLGESYTHERYIEISDQKEATFRDAIKDQVQLLPGVYPLINALRQAKIPQAIGSSSPQANIDAIVDELNLRPYFQALVSAVGMPGKPDPVVFLTAAQELGMPPESCIVVEDAIPGVEAARRASMKCVAVTTTNPAEDLQTADLVVDRLDTLTIGDLFFLVR